MKKTTLNVARRLLAMVALVAIFTMMFSINTFATEAETTVVAPETTKVSSGGATDDISVEMKEDGSLELGGITNADKQAWNTLFAKYKGVIVGVTGVATMTMIILLILQFLKLGSSAGNPQARSQALTGILWTGIAAALLGSVTIVMGFFYNALG